MKTHYFFFVFSLCLALALGACSDDIQSMGGLLPPRNGLVMSPYESILPADSCEAFADVYFEINDTTDIDMSEMENAANWRIKAVSFYESYAMYAMPTETTVLTDPTDTIRGDWFTVIREDGGKLRCIMSPNSGNTRAVRVVISGIGESDEPTCYFIQEGGK